MHIVRAVATAPRHPPPPIYPIVPVTTRIDLVRVCMVKWPWEGGEGRAHGYYYTRARRSVYRLVLSDNMSQRRSVHLIIRIIIIAIAYMLVTTVYRASSLHSGSAVYCHRCMRVQ